MTLQQCTKILTPLVLQLRADFDAPTFRAYHQALQDLPAPLLEAAGRLAARLSRKEYEPAFPTAPKLRALAERCRHELLAAHPYEGCCECEWSPGWRARFDQARTVERCPCWARHQAKLAALGIGDRPIAQLEAAHE